MKTNSFIKSLMFFSLCLVLLSGLCKKDPELIVFTDSIQIDFNIQPTAVGQTFPTTVEVLREKVISLKDEIERRGLDPTQASTISLEKYLVKLISPAEAYRDLSAVSEVKVYLFVNGRYQEVANGNNYNAAVTQFSLTAIDNTVSAEEVKAYMLTIADKNDVVLKYKYTYVLDKAIEQEAAMQSIYELLLKF
jgi:hypothetical protein